MDGWVKDTSVQEIQLKWPYDIMFNFTAFANRYSG